MKINSFFLTALLAYSCYSSASAVDCDIPNPVMSGISNVITLDAKCTYNKTIVIDQSNTTLNCNNAKLDGENEIPFGILIRGKAINNINISNCNVYGFKKSGIMIASSSKILRDGNHSTYYENAPKGVSIYSSNIHDNLGTGLTFNAYVTDSKIENSIIENNKGVGIYLSQSSQRIKVDSNKISTNGIRGRNGREGVAIDSSANNIITNNYFSSNAAGGIFLYKNCGEHYNNDVSVLRWQHSNHNFIAKNKFQNEKVGVWVASRQSQNLKKWDCGDQPVDASGEYFKDYADDNMILNNTFCNVQQGIILEGNKNKVFSNGFNMESNIWVLDKFRNNPQPDGTMNKSNEISGNHPSLCQ